MLEIPEANVLAEQLTQSFAGRTIEGVVAGASPHGFAFYTGLPESYPALLEGRTLGAAKAVGGNVEIAASGATLLFGDGVNLRYIPAGTNPPKKHQLLLTFDDGSALVASVQMYGGMWAYLEGTNDSPYYLGALEKPSPLTDAFDAAYFGGIVAAAKPKLSAKALLATEQRIPGLGNGVLQDILFLSGIHPQKPVGALADSQLDTLFFNVKNVLRRMTDEGGRDIEKDLYGKPGRYHTLLSRKTLAYPCPKCGSPLARKAYLGGNVYFCPVCQPLG